MIIVYQYVQYVFYYLPVIAFCTREFLYYDDGCHLKKYSQNPSRSSATETTKLLASLSIVVDKMHMKGHTDSWCKKHCDPWLFSELDKARMC